MDNKNFRKFILELYEQESAHISLENALEGIKEDSISKLLKNQPYSIWQLVEHIRTTQLDIVEFSTNPEHVSAPWPESFWPQDTYPKDLKAWENTISLIKKDRERMIKILKDDSIDLLKPFPFDKEKNLFREAILLLDHTSYHVGQIVVIRKLLNDW